ncbi:hypothetical protein AVEN_38738-1 [Araneus ventricosus]|uniref:Uncharacterized protein n=1 Tax=Araneus ventricosus TaxID=182803 RepID=A0A4Y2KE97_ARAVE|nr:hypothetical protein AVEN_38738-1 [Araneus ventricosus]
MTSLHRANLSTTSLIPSVNHATQLPPCMYLLWGTSRSRVPVDGSAIVSDVRGSSCREQWKTTRRFGLCSRDRCVCGDKGNPKHYATDSPVTKPFHFRKPSAENISTWCVNIFKNKRSLARLINIMKTLHDRRHDIIID